ncbi:MAG: DUF167 domain-containing protein [Armatimonadota bacterium]
MAPAVKIPLKVIPNAPKDEVVGWRGSDLTVKITAPPLDGRANDHLLRYLAEVFAVAPMDITFLSGETSRKKTVRIAGLTAAEARAQLEPHIG